MQSLYSNGKIEWNARICACYGNCGTWISICTYSDLDKIVYRGCEHCSIDKPFPSYADKVKHILLSRTWLRAQVMGSRNKLPDFELLGRVLVNKMGSVAFEDLKKDKNGRTLYHNFNCPRPHCIPKLRCCHRLTHMVDNKNLFVIRFDDVEDHEQIMADIPRCVIARNTKWWQN